jgi:site-specific DNA-methyltransferase (adenine-specific)/modification methylase
MVLSRKFVKLHVVLLLFFLICDYVLNSIFFGNDFILNIILMVNFMQSKTIEKHINTLIEGDCLSIMESIPSHSVDMIICDLPYGTTQNKWDSVIPLNNLWMHYKRIIKENGVIALTSQGIFTAKLIISNEKWFKYKYVWVKSKPTNFLNAKKQPLRKHEDVCIFYNTQPVYNPQKTVAEPYNKGVRKNQLSGSYGDFKPVEVKSAGERYPTDVLYFKTSESEGEVFHPTQKPIELGRFLIRTYTDPGAIIMDNAFGSGSFLVAAVLEERNFIGIEKNEDVHLFKKKKINYIDVAHDRIISAYNKVCSSLFAKSTLQKKGLFIEIDQHLNNKRVKEVL